MPLLHTLWPPELAAAHMNLSLALRKLRALCEHLEETGDDPAMLRRAKMALIKTGAALQEIDPHNHTR